MEFQNPLSTPGFAKLYFIDNNPNANNGEVQIGATLQDTINNVSAFFNTYNYFYNFASIFEIGADYIDFEIIPNANDSQKYLDDNSGINNNNFWIEQAAVNNQRDLDKSLAKMLADISNNNFNYMLSIYNWATNQNTERILDYYNLYNSSIQSIGTLGAFGMRYFTNDTEAKAAIMAALQSTNGGKFFQLFNIVSPLSGNGGYYTMTIEDKVSPTGNANLYFQSNSITSNDYNVIPNVQANTTQEPIGGTPEHVPYAVIGRIEDIDLNTNEVLISTSKVMELTMCSAADGAFGTIPLSIEYIKTDGYGTSTPMYPYIIPFRKGKVIDFFGYINKVLDGNINNLSNSPAIYNLFFNQSYRPLTAAKPDEKVIADTSIQFPFFDN
jgi:hypothetical protein